MNAKVARRKLRWAPLALLVLLGLFVFLFRQVQVAPGLKEGAARSEPEPDESDPELVGQVTPVGAEVVPIPVSDAEQVEASLLVQSDALSPISGAVVFVREVGGLPSDWERLGSTDQGGVFRTKLSTAGLSLMFAAAAEGFQCRQVQLLRENNSSGPPVQIVITLPTAALMHGRVIWGGGGGAASPQDAIEVAAVLASEPLLAAAEWSPLGGPFSCKSELAADGSFTLTQIDPSESYRLIAYGPRILSLDKPVVSASDRPVELVVGRLCAAIIELIDPVVGGAPRAAQGAYGKKGMQCASVKREGVINPIILDEVDAVLSGVDPRAISWNARDRRLIAYSGTRDAVVVGPFKYSIDLPGYELASMQFEMPCDDAPIPEIEVVLDAKAGGWGNVAVTFQGSPPGPPTNVGPFALLILHSVAVSPDAGHIEIPIEWRSSNEPFVVHGIPAGKYRASLAVGPFRREVDVDGTLDLLQGATENVVFDLSAFGSVSLSIYDTQHRDFGGQMLVEVQDAHKDPGYLGKSVLFRRAPYIIAGVPARSTRFRATTVMPLHTAGIVETTAELIPGEINAVDLAPIP